MATKQPLKKVTFTLPQNIYQLIENEAEDQSRTISGQILYIVKKYYQQNEDDK